jgi:transposase-like protein
MQTGRPPDYKPEFAEQARKLCLYIGATDQQLADFFEVDVRTIYRWKLQHEEFCQSLKIGKAETDLQVERSLLNRALGYEHDAVKIFCSKDGDVTSVPYREVVPPDVTACIFWLKNRKQKEWRDKAEIEVTDKIAERLENARKRRV